MFRAREQVLKWSNRTALGLLVSALLLSPVFLGGRFASLLLDVSWSDQSDIFVLSWSSGIVSLFISVVYVELFRQSLRKVFLYQCLAFFSIGVSELLYSLLSISFREAIWFKAGGAVTAGLVLIAGAMEFRRQSRDLLGPFLRNVVAVCGLLILFNVIPMAPGSGILRAYAAGGHLSAFCVFAFYAAGVFFLIGSIPWLNSYWRLGEREHLNTGLTILCLGELFLLSRFIVLWTFFWWLWHLLFLCVLLALALYLITTSVRRSLIWKIVLSLALLFSATMLVSFWATRKYYDGREKEMALRAMSSSLSASRARAFSELKASSVVLSTMSSAIESGLGGVGVAGLRNTIERVGAGFARTKYEDVGWLGENGTFVCFSGREPAGFAAELLKAAKAVKDARSRSAMFRIIPGPAIGLQEGKSMILMVQSCTVGPSKGVSFLLCEGAFLLKRAIVDDVFGDGLEWGKVIYDVRARRILFGRHPPSPGPGVEDFERRLAASLVSLACERRKMNSKEMLEESPDSSLLVFAEMEPLSGWVVADYTVWEPSFGKKPLRIHMMAAMVSMLLGILAMLFMLDIQLNHPLKGLMRAGLSLQAGNFDYRSGSRREDEIGVVENVFDQTAERLKILYGNLRRSIEEKDDALKKVKRIEKEKMDFFNALSHELKSPIHSIINFSRFGMSSSQDTNKDYFEKSYESAIRLLGIIEELLQIARIESLPRGEVGEFCLRECVQNSAWRLTGQTQAKKVKFDMRFRPDDVKQLPIVADRKQIEILLSNIIGNAVKYTESGSTVSISCERRGDNYSIKVSDEGPGVPEKEMDKLFQEFRRLTGSKDGGSGLGLYISRKIAEMHGGTIYACNNPSKGMCFCITLPVRNEEKRRSEDTCR